MLYAMIKKDMLIMLVSAISLGFNLNFLVIGMLMSQDIITLPALGGIIISLVFIWITHKRIKKRTEELP